VDTHNFCKGNVRGLGKIKQAVIPMAGTASMVITGVHYSFLASDSEYCSPFLSTLVDLGNLHGGVT
jgi:hypothetical protein